MRYLILFLTLLFTVPVTAQKTRGNGKVQGTITTNCGEAISNSTVKLLNTKYCSTTDSEGNYSIGR